MSSGFTKNFAVEEKVIAWDGERWWSGKIIKIKNEKILFQSTYRDEPMNEPPNWIDREEDIRKTQPLESFKVGDRVFADWKVEYSTAGFWPGEIVEINNNIVAAPIRVKYKDNTTQWVNENELMKDEGFKPATRYVEEN